MYGSDEDDMVGEEDRYNNIRSADYANRRDVIFENRAREIDKKLQKWID